MVLFPHTFFFVPTSLLFNPNNFLFFTQSVKNFPPFFFSIFHGFFGFELVTTLFKLIRKKGKKWLLFLSREYGEGFRAAREICHQMVNFSVCKKGGYLCV